MRIRIKAGWRRRANSFAEDRGRVEGKVKTRFKNRSMRHPASNRARTESSGSLGVNEEREKPHSFSRKNGAPDLAFRACSFRKSVPPAARGAVTSPFIRCMIKLLRSVSSVFKAIWTVMDLREALSNADQILDEERIHPTVKYDCLPQERDSVTRALVAVAGSMPSKLFVHWFKPSHCFTKKAMSIGI